MLYESDTYFDNKILQRLTMIGCIRQLNINLNSFFDAQGLVGLQSVTVTRQAPCSKMKTAPIGCEEMNGETE